MIGLMLKFHFDKNDDLLVWVYDFVEYTLLPRPIVSMAAKKITEVYIQRSIPTMSSHIVVRTRRETEGKGIYNSKNV